MENPDAIRALHKGYIDAGADMILTNTFGGSPIRLTNVMICASKCMLKR